MSKRNPLQVPGSPEWDDAMTAVLDGAPAPRLIQMRNVEVGMKLNVGSTTAPELGVVTRVTVGSKRVDLAIDIPARADTPWSTLGITKFKSETVTLWNEGDLEVPSDITQHAADWKAEATQAAADLLAQAQDDDTWTCECGVTVKGDPNGLRHECSPDVLSYRVPAWSLSIGDEMVNEGFALPLDITDVYKSKTDICVAAKANSGDHCGVIHQFVFNHHQQVELALPTVAGPDTFSITLTDLDHTVQALRIAVHQLLQRDSAVDTAAAEEMIKLAGRLEANLRLS